MFVPSVSFLIYDAYSNQVPGTRTHESGGLNCILSQGHARKALHSGNPCDVTACYSTTMDFRLNDPRL